MLLFIKDEYCSCSIAIEIKVAFYLFQFHACLRTSNTKCNSGDKSAQEDVEVIEADPLFVTNECRVPLLAGLLKFLLSAIQFSI